MDNKFEKEATDVAHTSKWHTFEMVFGVPFLIAAALQFTVPLSLPQGILTVAVLPVGISLIVLGSGLIILARRELAQYNQPTDPGDPTSKLVTTGVFSISRNPLYLGGIFFVAGIALALSLAWVLMLLLPALIVYHYILIVPEEQYLAEKFGEEYHNYAASVYRWMGRTRQEKSE